MPQSEVVFREEDHTYWQDGRRVVGATELLKHFGFINGDYYTPRGREIGRAVHSATEYLDQRDLDWSTIADPAIENRVRQYEDFKREKRFAPTVIERVLVCPAPLVACRVDRIGAFGEDSTPCIVELKAGAEESWHRLQTAIQELCARDVVAGAPYVRRFALYLPATGKYRLREHRDPTERGIVAGLAAAWQWKANHA